MRLGHILLFLTSFALAFGAVPARKAAAQKAPTSKAASGKAAVSKAPVRKGRKAAVRGPSYSRQQQPTVDRYREIQQALVEKGYMKSEPTGVWGAESIEALKQFQAAKNIPVTGRLNSRSIIGLGLGPRTPLPPVMPPSPETAPPARP